MKKGWKISYDRSRLWTIAILAILLIALIIYAVNVRRAECGRDSCSADNSAGIANPASVYCVVHNGTLNIVTAADGSQRGICKFENGSECDEWKFFRGEC